MPGPRLPGRGKKRGFFGKWAVLGVRRPCPQALETLFPVLETLFTGLETLFLELETVFPGLETVSPGAGDVSPGVGDVSPGTGKGSPRGNGGEFVLRGACARAAAIQSPRARWNRAETIYAVQCGRAPDGPSAGAGVRLMVRLVSPVFGVRSLRGPDLAGSGSPGRISGRLSMAS